MSKSALSVFLICSVFLSHSAGSSLRMESSSSVPEVAKNVEVVSNNNDLALERELARADSAALMKRSMSEGESGEEEEGGEYGRKIPKVTQQRGMYTYSTSIYYMCVCTYTVNWETFGGITFRICIFHLIYFLSLGILRFQFSTREIFFVFKLFNSGTDQG